METQISTHHNEVFQMLILHCNWSLEDIPTVWTILDLETLADLQANPANHSFDVQQASPFCFNVPYCLQFNLSLFIVSVTTSKHFKKNSV